ncbi:serine hydrolase domain-containing protein [Planctomyces sp. SH-PL62]|uniref:serine hydrolase domain-containing protein n=1 Tax=Planctomyces sp. SH-PL62 TaxID=1636152 RepID=UPI00078EE364|nr:serine hydrolase [Planctomyces sp. SH-PL62]AMV40750.1 6-aminohexanoate-dimer hydrolase [Planctomyces sp. SH-PL62]
MKRIGWAAGLFACLGALAFGSEPLSRSEPEAQGVSSKALREFVLAADGIDSFHSVMLVRHGRVVAEGWWAPYDAETRHELYSLSKSFTATAVGLAVAEGKLSVDDPVLKFFPEDAPENPDANLKAMRVSDLLRMSTGHQDEPKRPEGEVWTKVFLAHPVPHKPGTHFLYNTSGTYMASAIVQKATGQTVLDYLRPRLFDPLGIDDPSWGESPQGVSLGGYGLSVQTEDVAKFGQLYLQKGRWNGKQLVPESWVAAATSLQTSNGSNPRSDWEQGYGYQFWRARHGAYRGDGAFGQYCLVMPEQDAVLAITSGVKDMQAVLDLVWDRLLPAFADAPLPADPDAREALTATLKGLTLRAPEGAATPGSSVKAAGRTFKFGDNPRKLESLKLEPGEGAATLVLRVDGAEHRIPCGRGEWVKSRAALGGFPEQPVAAAAAWTADDVLTARVVLIQTPFHVTYRIKFEGDRATLDPEVNVGFGATRGAALVGAAE